MGEPTEQARALASRLAEKAESEALRADQRGAEANLLVTEIMDVRAEGTADDKKQSKRIGLCGCRQR